MYQVTDGQNIQYCIACFLILMHKTTKANTGNLDCPQAPQSFHRATLKSSELWSGNQVRGKCVCACVCARP